MRNPYYNVIFYAANDEYKHDETFHDEAEALSTAKQLVGEGKYEYATIEVTGRLADVRRNKGVKVTR